LTERDGAPPAGERRRIRRRHVIGFCGEVIPGRDPREAGVIEIGWGGVAVEVPLARLRSFTPLYRYVCAEWVLEAQKGEQPLHPVRRLEEQELDPEVDRLLKENCVAVDGEREWLCTEAFFTKLYPRQKEYLGAGS